MSSRPSAFTLTSPGPLRLFSTNELLTRPTPPWFIEGIFPSGGLVSIFGPPGCGKSFLSIDMALCAAAGQAWQGRPLTGGYVLYIAAEGGPGIGKRARAWLAHHRVKPGVLNLAWATEPMAVFKESGELDTLNRRLDLELDVAPAMIVVDTLARCFEGDENQQLDMGAFVAGCDQLRNQYGATVLVIHHTRLDGERERGNTAFKGAMDTMVELKPHFRKGSTTLDTVDVLCAKQKDAESFEPFTLRLTPVPGTDSAVITPENFDVNQYALLSTLYEHRADQPWSSKDIIALMDSLHHWSERKTFYEMRCSVKSKDLLRKNGEYLLHCKT